MKLYTMGMCFLLLSSCRTTERYNCNSYRFIQLDTITLTTEHINFGGNVPYQ